MTTTIKNTVAGIVLASVAMFGAMSAKAQTPTIDSLMAQIAALTAQIAAMQGGSASATCGTTTYGYTATSTLKAGMKGASVSALQSALNMYAGASISTDGSFGPMTANAVKAFQASKGLVADGIAGPATQGALQTASMMSGGSCDNNGGTTTPGSLNGTGGDVTLDLSFASDMQIDLGDTEEVVEFDIEAVDGDVRIDRVDFTFDARPWLYFSEVNLLVNGSEVASLDGSSDFSEVSGDWRARFSGLNIVIEEDEVETFVLELKALSSLPADRLDDTVNIVMGTGVVRFVDGSGAIMTTDLSGVDVDITFAEDFGNGDLGLSLAENSPEDATIVLKETTRTEGVTVLVFEAEAEDSDIELTDVSVSFALSTTSTVGDAVHRAYLYRGNTLLKQKSVTATSVSVVFDDIDYMIDEDDTETFTVKVDFNEAESFNLGNFTVSSVTATGEDEDFVTVSDTLTVSEEHTLIEAGLTDSFSSKSATNVTVGNNSNAKFQFVFDLTAYENNYFLAEDGSDFAVTIGSTGTTTGTSILSRSLTSNATEVGDSFRVNKNQTRTFTLEVEVSTTSTTQQSVFVTVGSLTYYTNLGLTTGISTLNLSATSYKSSNATVVLAP